MNDTDNIYIYLACTKILLRNKGIFHVKQTHSYFSNALAFSKKAINSLTICVHTEFYTIKHLKYHEYNVFLRRQILMHIKPERHLATGKPLRP